jgi:hypothetical protein
LLEPKIIFRSESQPRIGRHTISINRKSSIYEALNNKGILKAKEQMKLDGDDGRYQIESMKLGNGDYVQVLTMVIFNNGPKDRINSFRKTPQLSLFLTID